LQKVLAILPALFSIAVSYGQNIRAACYQDNFTDTQFVFTKMELLPHYKGYEQELNKFIINEINIAEICNKLPDSVRVFEDSAKVKFIIAKNGQMSNLAVKSVHTTLEDELTKALIKSSCSWFPGYSNRNLNGWYNGTIYFKIDRTKNSLSVTVSSIPSYP